MPATGQYESELAEEAELKHMRRGDDLDDSSSPPLQHDPS